MNKKVFKTMIALVIVFLLSLYILKIFFPEQFVIVIQNEQLIKIGSYVDTHLWLHIILACITSFITYWLYLCSVLQKWFLNWKQVICVLVTIALTQLLYEFDISIATYLPLISMIIIPAIFNADIKIVAMVFSTHCIAQLLSISIRNLPALLTNVNYATTTLMGVESYIWLLLFYLLFNYKKGE